MYIFYSWLCHPISFQLIMCSIAILPLILIPQYFPDITVSKSVLWCCPAWIWPHQPEIMCSTTTPFNKSSNLTYMLWIKLTTLYLEGRCWNHWLTCCVWGINFTTNPDFITFSWRSPNSLAPSNLQQFLYLTNCLTNILRNTFTICPDSLKLWMI